MVETVYAKNLKEYQKGLCAICETKLQEKIWLDRPNKRVLCVRCGIRLEKELNQ